MSRSVGTVLSIKDKMSSPLVGISGKVKNVTRDMRRSQNQVKRWTKSSVKGMDKVLKTASKVALASGALAGGFVVKSGWEGLRELDDGSRKVKSIAKDSLQLKNIQKDLLKQSNKTGIAVKELSDTQYSAISSGVNSANSMMASVKASKLAVAGYSDANSSLKIVTATMNVYGQTGEKAMSAIADKLMVTQNLGVTTVGELANSMGGLTPVANAANLGVDELLSGMASLTKNGMKTEEAVSAYKGVLTSVIKPSSEAAKMAKKLGIDFSVSAIKSKGFAGFLEDVRKKTGGNTETMGKLFGNVKALSGSLILTGKGLKDFKTNMDAMGDSAGSVDQAYKIATGSIGYKVDKLKNIFKNTSTSIMNTQSGLLGKYVDKLDTWISNNEDKIQSWVKAIGKSIARIIKGVKTIFNFLNKHKDIIIFIASFVTGMYAVLKVIGFLKVAMGALNTIWLILNGTLVITPIGWIVIGIGALVAVIVYAYRHIDVIKTKWSEFGDKFPRIHKLVNSIGELLKVVFISHINKICKELKIFWEIIKAVFSGILEHITIQFDNVLNFIENILAGNFKEAATNLVDIFLQPFKTIYKIISNIFKKVKSVINSDDVISLEIKENDLIKTNGMQKYAKGGIANKASIFGEAGAEMAIPLKKNNPRSKSLLTQADQIINGTSSNESQLVSNSESTNSGAVIQVIIQGDNYGFKDFKEKVIEAVVEGVEKSKMQVVKAV